MAASGSLSISRQENTEKSVPLAAATAVAVCPAASMIWLTDDNNDNNQVE